MLATRICRICQGRETVFSKDEPDVIVGCPTCQSRHQVVTCAFTTLQLISARGIGTVKRAEEVRRSMLIMGYSVGAVRRYETEEGTRWAVDGTKQSAEEVSI